MGSSPAENKRVECQLNAHTHVCWNIQLASELIVVQGELGQIDEVAELLGQFACKVEMSAIMTVHVCWDIHLAE